MKFEWDLNQKSSLLFFKPHFFWKDIRRLMVTYSFTKKKRIFDYQPTRSWKSPWQWPIQDNLGVRNNLPVFFPDLSYRIFLKKEKNIFHFETKASKLWNSFDDFNIDKKLSMVHWYARSSITVLLPIINIKIRQYTFPPWYDWTHFHKYICCCIDVRKK